MSYKNIETGDECLVLEDLKDNSGDTLVVGGTIVRCAGFIDLPGTDTLISLYLGNGHTIITNLDKVESHEGEESSNH